MKFYKISLSVLDSACNFIRELDDFDDYDDRDKLSPVGSWKSQTTHRPYAPSAVADSQSQKSRRQSEPYIKGDHEVVNDYLSYTPHSRGDTAHFSGRRRNLTNRGGVQSRIMHRMNVNEHELVASDRDERFSDFEDRLSDRDRMGRRVNADDWDTMSDRGGASRHHGGRAAGGTNGKRRRASEMNKRNLHHNRSVYFGPNKQF